MPKKSRGREMASSQQGRLGAGRTSSAAATFTGLILTMTSTAHARTWTDVLPIDARSMPIDWGRRNPEIYETDPFEFALEEESAAPTRFPISLPTRYPPTIAPTSAPALESAAPTSPAGSVLSVPLSSPLASPPTLAPTISAPISAPDRPTDKETVPSKPLRPDPGQTMQLFYDERNATFASSYDGEILLLEMVLFRKDADGLPISIPAGRSYDGRDWEAVAPLYLTYDCSPVSPLPTSYDDAPVSYYRIKSVVVEPTTPEQDAAKLLIQTTFGPTRQGIDEIVSNNISPEQWLKRQMDETLTPPTLHRAHYRQHANQRLRPGAGQGTTDTFGIRSPCDVGSRWNRFAFTDLDVGKEMAAKTLPSGSILLTIDGRARTEVSSYSVPTRVIVCSVQEYVGGSIVLSSKNAEKLCRKGSTATIRNPAISFGDDTVTTHAVPDAYLEDMEPKVVDSLLLRTLRLSSNDNDYCPFSGPGPIFVRAWGNPSYLGSYSYYAHDPRAQLLDATPGSTDSYPQNSLASSIATCPSIPKSFLNEETCQPMRGDCSGISYGTGKRVTLDYETMRRFYELDGRYIYVVKGLPVEGTSSPCAPAKRKHRWVRYDANNDAQGCPGGDTVLPAEVSAKLIGDIRGELVKRGRDARLSVRAIDVNHNKERCNDGDAAVGARLSVPRLGCWTHSNSGEWGVYDASWCVFSHPGNSPRHRRFLSNPISDVAELEVDKDDLEKSVTLTFPAWHPLDRWKIWHWSPKSLGGFGDEVDFSRLPREVQGPGMAQYLGAISAGHVDDTFEFCGSPGEVANDPKRGHQYGLYDESDVAKVAPTSLDQDHEPEYSKAMVWTSVALNSYDQFRQRMAFALSQIFVVSSSGLEMRKQTEPFATYYDIFVRHAFGRFGDILKEVSFSPMMGRYLTYLGSKSFGHSYEELGMRLYPDENYAREIMQLFTLGLYLLHENGTQKLDSQGNPLPTYTNQDIMTLARGWTGFGVQESRSNLESSGSLRRYGQTNDIDPMQISPKDGRDVFPKLGLDLGNGEERSYIGDGVPLCRAMPTQAFLRKGATYRYLGSDPSLTLSRADVPFQARHKKSPRLILNPDTSSLYKALCNADPDIPGSKCRFRSTVVLEENLPCDGTCLPTRTGGDQQTSCECSVDEARVVRLDASVASMGSRRPIYYEYVRPPCVSMAFESDKSLTAAKEISPTGSAICADANLPVAGTACCDEGSDIAESVCVFLSERVSFGTAEERCRTLNRTTCSWNKLPANARCGTINSAALRGKKQGLQYQWTNSPCSLRAQIDHEGNVAVVHDVSPLNHRVSGRVSSAGATYFSVSWSGDGSFPRASDGCSSLCSVEGSSCLCQVQVINEALFTGYSLPSRQTILQSALIGAPDPSSFESGTYRVCETPMCGLMRENQGIVIYMRTTRVVSGDNQVLLDKHTIFELLDHDEESGQSLFLSNIKSNVHIGGRQFSFRNPPMYGSPVDQTQRDGLYETDTIIKTLLHHPNVAPFIATRLIQLLITSNPSPRYIQSVAKAFKTGRYTIPHSQEAFGKGQYGDLSAVAAAIFLDAEARSATIDADGNHGRAREPLLKVMHLLRSMELRADEERLLNLPLLREKIGQEAHYSPSVFSFFLPEYQPTGPVLEKGLASPESQLLDPPQIINFINGATSLPKYGLADCGGGFGSITERFQIKDRPYGDYFTCGSSASKVPYQLTWEPSSWSAAAVVVRELDMLLTGGKLSQNNREIIATAYSNMLSSSGRLAAVDLAQSMVALSPEFHSTNNLLQTEISFQRREQKATVATYEAPSQAVTDYKAVVYLFLAGGTDSHSILVPLDECTPTNLYEQYKTIRGNMAIGRRALLPINTAPGSQPCNSFGLHPSLRTIKQLYADGDAVFLANVGSLVTPLTKLDVENKVNGVPPSLYAHNTQKRATQTIQAQNPRANGILGRLGDALNLQASEAKGEETEVFSAYSISGSPKALEGAPGVSRVADVLSSRGIAGLSVISRKLEGHMRNLHAQKASSVYAETYSDRVTSSLARVKELGSKLKQKRLVKGPWDLPEEAPACCKSDICLQLQQVARVMNSRDVLDAKRDAFFVQQDGYDTHNNNLPRLKKLLDVLDKSLKCFADELKAQGIWKNTTVVVASDFGRSLTSNGLGTDHGWAGNYMVVGGAVKGSQILGEYPDDLTEESRYYVGRGRVLPTVPWDAVWNAIAEWMGVDQKRIKDVLPNLSNFGQEKIFEKADLFA